MKKIPTMYVRDDARNGHPVKNEIKPECKWVEDGEGKATRKMDGTNVCIKDGKFLKRKKPKERDYDNASYVPVEPTDPSNKYIWEAYQQLHNKVDGIYEAVGPKIQGNPEEYIDHRLVCVVPPEFPLDLKDVPRTFDGLKDYLYSNNIEGVVFHHPDGRFSKIKKRDFGFKREAK